MESDEHEMLERTLELEEENNKILKKMHRSIQWGRFFSFLYWAIIIGSAIGAYYFLQPVFESFSQTFDAFSSNVENVKRAGGSLPNIDSLLKSLNQNF